MSALQAQQVALAARSVQVLVVSFGGLEGAGVWLQQTGCSFPLLLDPGRKLYRTFGLDSSHGQVLRFGTLLRYSEFPAQERPFPDVPSHLLEDIYQMGGDFLLSDSGAVLLRRPSKTPLDRPALGDILAAADGAH